MANSISNTSDNVKVNTKSCILCESDIKYVAIFRGNHTPEIVGLAFEAIPVEAHVTGRQIVNVGKAIVANFEFIVKCPSCGSNNKMTDYKEIPDALKAT